MLVVVMVVLRLRGMVTVTVIELPVRSQSTVPVLLPAVQTVSAQSVLQTLKGPAGAQHCRLKTSQC